MEIYMEWLSIEYYTASVTMKSNSFSTYSHSRFLFSLKITGGSWLSWLTDKDL